MSSHVDKLIKMRSDIDKERKANEKTRKQLESKILELSKQKVPSQDKKKYKKIKNAFDQQTRNNVKKKPSERITSKVDQDFLELPPKDK